MPNLAALIVRARWIKTARDNQITPTGSWRIWLILAGRGWGKTRTGAEDIAHYVLWQKDVRVGIIAPTFADARDVCIEGESGLLRILPAVCVKAWHRSTGDLHLYNGSRVKLFSADQPDRLRGPQHHRVWCDELAAWPSREAFDQLWFGLRLGDDPRVVITTTPKNTPLIRELVTRAGEDVFLTKGKTYDNQAHLAPLVLAQLRAQYDGSRLGRQELEAEVLEDVEGALWPRAMIESCRATMLPELTRVVIGIDPAMSSNINSDETGIVAAGRGIDGLIYILADWSCRETPEGWARRAINLFRHRNAQLIVAEVNAGGDLVERIIRQSDPSVPYKAVRALRGKIERALPIVALYEQGRVKHVPGLGKLEEQMIGFSSQEIQKNSPDRVDAMVWAVSELTSAAVAQPRVRAL